MTNIQSTKAPRRVSQWDWRLPLAQLAVIAGLILLWQFAPALGIMPRSAVSTPGAVLSQFVNALGQNELWVSIYRTLESWAIGLLIALVVGNALGALIGSSKKLIDATRFLVDFFRSVPSVALVPLAVLLFGSSLKMKLLLITFGATWDVLIQALYAVRQVDPVALQTLKTYKVSPFQRLIHFQIPSALPFVLTGLRIAAIHALMLSIGAEIVGGAEGLGLQLMITQDEGSVALMFVYLITTGVLGVLINKGILMLRNKVLYWDPSVRGR